MLLIEKLLSERASIIHQFIRDTRPGILEIYYSSILHPINFFIFSKRHFRLLDSGYVDLVQERGSLEAAREISDHVPVWVRFELK